MNHAVTATPTAAKGHHFSIDCPWCRRLLPLCNGQRTISEIASRIYLPTQVVIKLLNTAAEKAGWIPGVRPLLLTIKATTTVPCKAN